MAREAAQCVTLAKLGFAFLTKIREFEINGL
jgi:hypothetical protein